jgi:hypothetical protein
MVCFYGNHIYVEHMFKRYQNSQIFSLFPVFGTMCTVDVFILNRINMDSKSETVKILFVIYGVAKCFVKEGHNSMKK